MDQGHTSTETPNLSGKNAFAEPNRDASPESNPFTTPEHSGEPGQPAPGQLAPGQPAANSQAIGQNVLESFMPNTAPQAPAAGAEDLNRNPLDPLEVSTPDQSPLTTEPHNITAEQPLANPDSAQNIGSLALEQNKTPYTPEQQNSYRSDPNKPISSEIEPSSATEPPTDDYSTSIENQAIINSYEAKDNLSLPNFIREVARAGFEKDPATAYMEAQERRRLINNLEEGKHHG